MTKLLRFEPFDIGWRAVVVFCVLLLAAHLQGQEMRPDFRKLAPVALCPPAAEFARTNGIPLEGIAPPSDTGGFKPGDSVTGLITLFEKGGRKSQWLLCIVAAEPTAEERARPAKPPMIWYMGAGDKVEFSRAAAPATLRLVGPFVERKGKAMVARIEDETARINVNQSFLGIGLDPAAAATYRICQHHLHGSLAVRPRPFTDAEIAEGRKSMAGLQLSLAEQRAIAGANLALNSYTRIVQETPGLDRLFFKVVKPPSFWSIVSHLGVKISVELEKPYVSPTEATAWNLPAGTPCFTYPLALRVNNQPALTATLVVSPPRPPLLECAGIVGLLAENPSDKETYLLLRIISARRQSGTGD